MTLCILSASASCSLTMQTMTSQVSDGPATPPRKVVATFFGPKAARLRSWLSMRSLVRVNFI